MTISSEAAAIDGKTFQFGLGASYARGNFSNGSVQTVEGQTVNSGFVFQDSNHGYAGTVTFDVTDANAGTVLATTRDLDFQNISFQSTYNILGSDVSGQYLVLGSSGGFPQLFVRAEPFDQSSPQTDTFTYDSRNDFNGNHLIGLGVPCFVTGTLIRTPHGDVAVEDLIVGESVLTASGEAAAVQWIGHHTVRCDLCFDPTLAWPICIRADAFGVGKPDLDLFVSPGHAIWVPFLDDGVLIPASSLVNGSSIAQIEAKTVTYWHVELENHDILLANGLPAESYVDVGNRSFFTSTDSHVAPDGVERTTADYCRPFFKDGPVVQAVWQALKARAFKLGWTLEEVIVPRMHIVADGIVIDPAFDGNRARFLLSAGVRDVWLVSETSVPYHVMDIPDHRRLGVRLDALSISDGLGVQRQIALDDRLLCTGFHRVEEDGTRRWTAGRARLPAALWEGCRDIVIVQIGFLGLLPRWVEPVSSGADLSPSRLNADLPRPLAARTH
ncbi:Hint domain-containing protein [Sphingomonas sp. PsM26]|nr:Hint domain-containing protein [Sphingomonas sp. PsM26]